MLPVQNTSLSVSLTRFRIFSEGRRLMLTFAKRKQTDSSVNQQSKQRWHAGRSCSPVLNECYHLRVRLPQNTLSIDLHQPIPWRTGITLKQFSTTEQIHFQGREKWKESPLHIFCIYIVLIEVCLISTRVKPHRLNFQFITSWYC